MRAVVAAAFVACVVSLLGTPLAVRALVRLKCAQPIRELGIKAQEIKRGTPTMGGWVFILATILAYVAGHLAFLTLPAEQLRPRLFSPTAVVLLGLFFFMGVVGFVDDYLKVSRRNSAGLNKRGKLLGQVIVGGVFGAFAVTFTGARNHTVGSEYVSFVRDIEWLHIGKVGAVALMIAVVLSASNAVNLTDGLDGLATGASAIVLGSYAVIAFWQYRHWCADPTRATQMCYDVRDPLEIGIVAMAAAGACLGFLWWNTSPAKVFMGDTGSLGLGALIGGLAIATHTILLLPIIGALFVVITMSLMIQVTSFRTTGKRVFKNSPLHHHFELQGWSEVNIVTRFWIIAGVGVATGMGIFYGAFLAHAG
jgi:phospho-N-acetylmuramoyl-pentapeptide-transferase